MIGLDSNIVIRFLVQDDPKQSKKVNQWFDKWIQAEEVLWICQATLCEIFWVLERSYRLDKQELIKVLKLLLQTKIEVENSEVVWEALYDYEKNANMGFADCLIGRQNSYFKCDATYTFDKKAAKQLPVIFKLLQ